MAKRFMYVSIGILCLVAAYQMGVEQARADWTDSGLLRGITNLGIVDHQGVFWSINSGGEWDPMPITLPVPASSVKLLGIHSGKMVCVTENDEVWQDASMGDWHLLDPYPGSPVSIGSESWGQIKNRYRQEGE